jgi:hypothetical protein
MAHLHLVEPEQTHAERQGDGVGSGSGPERVGDCGEADVDALLSRSEPHSNLAGRHAVRGETESSELPRADPVRAARHQSIPPITVTVSTLR